MISDIKNDITFANINSIKNATEDDLSFFSNLKHLGNLKSIKSKACLIKKDFVKYLPKECAGIVVEDPYLAFAILTELFHDNINISNGILSHNSNIDNNAIIHNNVQVDPFCIIDKLKFMKMLK